MGSTALGYEFGSRTVGTGLGWKVVSKCFMYVLNFTLSIDLRILVRLAEILG